MTKFKIIRQALGLSQAEFAKSIGVSQPAVFKWEAGQSYPSHAKLIEIQKICAGCFDPDWSMDYIFSDSGGPQLFRLKLGYGSFVGPDGKHVVRSKKKSGMWPEGYLYKIRRLRKVNLRAKEELV